MLSQAINRYLLPRCTNRDPNLSLSPSTRDVIISARAGLVAEPRCQQFSLQMVKGLRRWCGRIKRREEMQWGKERMKNSKAGSGWKGAVLGSGVDPT